MVEPFSSPFKKLGQEKPKMFKLHSKHSWKGQKQMVKLLSDSIREELEQKIPCLLQIINTDEIMK